jgi:hypothetical protein
MCEGLLTRRAPRGPGKFGKAGHHAKPTPGAGIDCQILSHDRHATLRTHVTAAHHRCAADRSLARRTSQRRICVVRHRGAGSGKVAAVARQRSRGSPLSERVPASDLFYDPGTGQLIAGSLIDYALPRADDLPSYDLSFNGTRCTTNPLGVKGCGEACAVSAFPAVTNAVLDALAPLGVTALIGPATSERIWRAIRAGSLVLP